MVASWLEKEAELPSDLYAVLGTADPEKRCSKLFSAEHCTLLQAQNKDQLRAMSKADWLSTAAAKIVRDLANGQSEMMSEQVAKSLKEVQLLNAEAAQTRKEVLSSLVVSHVNMKMARRESLLKEVLPSFAKHSMDLMRLPLDSSSLFPEGNKVIASCTGRVQLQLWRCWQTQREPRDPQTQVDRLSLFAIRPLRPGRGR